jgi:CBS domain containing-hemolysin-like protein
LENAASILFNLLLVIFLVLLNGFFVAAEFAIVKVRSSRIAQMEYHRRKVAQKVLANLDAYLSATQLGITLASLGLGWIGEPAIAEMIQPLLRPILHYFRLDEWVLHAVAFAIAFSIITFMHIVLGEMAPKSLAIRQAEKTTLWTATPLDWFYRLFKPFIYILNGAANLTLRWFGIELNETQQAHTEEEIRMLIAQSHRSGVIDQTELTLFDNVFDFTDRVAREVMVPRVNMECLFLEDPFAENFEKIRNARHTRFPLCGEDKDDVKGIIHIRDVYERIASGETTPQLDQLARSAVVVPESMELKDILRNLQKNRAEMAIVVDEYGGTSGLVTTEDIIEEIFGEIQDEFDDEKPFFLKNGEETSVDARLLIEEVNEHFKINIEDEDNDTIGGWLFSELGTVPKVGDQVPFAQWLFTVEEVSQLRIARIMVTLADPQVQNEIEKTPLSM